MPSRPALATSGEVATSAPATRLQSLRWETLTDGSTRLVGTFDGALAAERVSLSRIGGDSPRAVVVVRGIVEAPRAGWEPATPVLTRIRPGHHPSVDGGELHLVLDLAGADVTVERVASARDLELLVHRRQ